MRYVSRCTANGWVFNADLKLWILSIGSRRESRNEFKIIGAALENEWRPNFLWQWLWAYTGYIDGCPANGARSEADETSRGQTSSAGWKRIGSSSVSWSCHDTVSASSVVDCVDCSCSGLELVFGLSSGPKQCGSYRAIKLLEHTMKVTERVFQQRIREKVKIDTIQFGFMLGKQLLVQSSLYDRCRRIMGEAVLFCRFGKTIW